MSLRIGIVGAGANTRLRHIPGFQQIKGVEVVAVCNRSRESGQKVADEFKIPQVFTDWKELVHNQGVDAVCIGTWPYLHCPIVLESLAAGKHVLTEARMAMDLAEARKMYTASQKSDKVAMIVPAPFWLESEAVLLEKIREGFFGDLLEIQVRGLGGQYNPDAPLHWRQRRDLSGINIMTLGILNETVRRYAGHDRSVVAQSGLFTAKRQDPDSGQLRQVEVPESIGVVSRLESGATAVYHVSSVARFGDSGIEVYGTRGTFKLSGDQCLAAGAGDQALKPLEMPVGRKGGWRVEEEFAQAVLEGKPVTHTNFEDGVKYMEFTEAVQFSLREGRKVELPLG
ncbi:MAG: Gfo/Idh/MocA family oxidoreductase [Candidatus Handelsmanbacteria bacterium]|nr:Gfo/Idh/MocA family oxidoreductase [Candidatus Handelsmanbacteria bacterium]